MVPKCVGKCYNVTYNKLGWNMCRWNNNYQSLLMDNEKETGVELRCD